MIQSDPFGMVTWPFQRLSDLQPLGIFKGSPKNRQVQDQFQGVDVPYEECTVSRFAFVWAVSDIMSGWKWYSFCWGEVDCKWLDENAFNSTCASILCGRSVSQIWHHFWLTKLPGKYHPNWRMFHCAGRSKALKSPAPMWWCAKLLVKNPLVLSTVFESCSSFNGNTLGGFFKVHTFLTVSLENSLVTFFWKLSKCLVFPWLSFVAN